MRRFLRLPPAERLRELFHYDPDSGELRWRIRAGAVHAGSVAGTRNKFGHLTVMIDGVTYQAHRLIFKGPDRVDRPHR
jgi:hypothetical protein